MTPEFDKAAVQEGETVEPVAPPTAVAADEPMPGIYVFPASLEQSRYWILDQLESGSTASNMAVAVRLEGSVDDAIAEQAIRELVIRHEALRTTYRMVEGQLSQIISENPSYRFSVADVRNEPADTRRGNAEALVLEHSHVPIDLSEGPVLHVRLIHETDQHHFLAITVHHIACDGWSNGILIRDFAEIYDAIATHRPALLPQLPFQFADFTVWQQEWLGSEAANKALSFWKEHVRRDMQAVDLPTDRPRGGRKSAPGHIESELLSGQLTELLKAYCRRNDATMHQVLLAAFEGLIARYTGQDQFLLGSTIANRTQPSMENVVGRFANPQVILADVADQPRYSDLLKRVIDWSSSAYAHQDLPFSKLMEEFQIDQAGAGSQFLQVYFVYQKAFMQPQQTGAFRVIPRPSVSGGVNFDLLVSIVERAEGPRLQMEYNTDLFDHSRIRRLIDQYIRVLEAVMHNDSLTVAELPLLSPSEQPVISGSERKRPSIPSTVSIPEWIDLQAERFGDGIALVAGKERISWKILTAKSRQYQQALTNLGVRPGHKVAVRIESSVAAVATVLALLRVGAQVIPVPETASSIEWNRLLVSLQPAASFAARSFAEHLTNVTSFEILSSTRGSAAPATEYPQSDNIAWWALQIDGAGHFQNTSATHATALQNLSAATEALDIRAGDSVVAFPADASVCAWINIMLPLVAGARLVLAGNIAASELQAVLDEEQATLALATPADWVGLLDEGWRGDRRLHAVCLGIRLPNVTAASLSRVLGRVSCLYVSPTASACAYARVDSDQDKGQPVSVLPLPGERLVVQDGLDNPSPFGVRGELAVDRGSGFIRTGLLASSRATGAIAIFDSIDRQVRIGGYRLLLGELDERLLQQPTIHESEAAVLRDNLGNPHLVAYVTASGQKAPSIREASRFLRTQAPSHLAGAELIAVDKIPRRVDGSPNFAELPQPGTKRVNQIEVAGLVNPRDELETRLVAIWEEVLGVRGIGIRTSFFSLGGYSLLIVRLFARINKAFDTSLPITTIFNAPTIAELADILRGQVIYSPLVPVQTKGAKPPFFMIHSYLLYEGLRSVLGDDRPLYGLRELDSDADMTLEARVASYVQEIRKVQPTGPYHLGGWCAAGPLAVETARQLKEAGEKVKLVVLFDSWRPGYAQELAKQHTVNAQMTFRAAFDRKLRFHKRNLTRLSNRKKIAYLWSSAMQKVRSVRNRLYLNHWAFAQRLFTNFGMPLPHFMHNISLGTLNMVREYKGQPYHGAITLVRATEATFVPGADPGCGWSTMATEGVETLWAPGNHESMFIEPNLSVVGEILCKSFEKASAS